ncbi:hypothetical protein Aph02nite_47000 [Actinoplanes philippinensis]|nr:hypothetical protein Aph02nite_47000 [Actinoplanes philippinensis]
MRRLAAAADCSRSWANSLPEAVRQVRCTSAFAGTSRRGGTWRPLTHASEAGADRGTRSSSCEPILGVTHTHDRLGAHASAFFTLFRGTFNRRAMAWIVIPSARRSRRISAQSSTFTTSRCFRRWSRFTRNHVVSFQAEPTHPTLYPRVDTTLHGGRRNRAGDERRIRAPETALRAGRPSRAGNQCCVRTG